VRSRVPGAILPRHWSDSPFSVFDLATGLTTTARHLFIGYTHAPSSSVYKDTQISFISNSLFRLFCFSAPCPRARDSRHPTFGLSSLHRRLGELQRKRSTKTGRIAAKSGNTGRFQPDIGPLLSHIFRLVDIYLISLLALSEC
jgi:hypothetical protein